MSGGKKTVISFMKTHHSIFLTFNTKVETYTAALRIYTISCTGAVNR
jgi:hypothetical protein